VAAASVSKDSPSGCPEHQEAHHQAPQQHPHHRSTPKMSHRDLLFDAGEERFHGAYETKINHKPDYNVSKSSKNKEQLYRYQNLSKINSSSHADATATTQTVLDKK
jgi:hypothetical protein